jgi:glycosyltransferase involved in cell wall biosynthesis
MEPKFSISIPNYNYVDYLGLTIDSVVKQPNVESIEILISDNSSNDGSDEVIHKYIEKYPFIKANFNKYNIGFSGNLDEASRMGVSPWMILLSSDDIISDNAMPEYARFINLLPTEERFAFTSTFEKIGSNGEFISFIGPDNISVWTSTDLDITLTERMGFNVYKVKSEVMLNRCLERFLNPFNFASTCYSRNSFEHVGGYSGGRVYNPDKWFHWKLLAVTDFVYFLDKPLFKYRWHDKNQAALETETGDLKYWIDEYRNTFECTPEILKQAGIDKKKVVEYFCLHISKHVLQLVSFGNYFQAERIYSFAKACYPNELSKSKYYLLMRLALLGKVLFRGIFSFYLNKVKK